MRTPKQIVKELEYLKKSNTSWGLLDYDGFAMDVIVFMRSLKKEIRAENKSTKK